MSDLKSIKNIYLYKILALIVSFASIFVVVPFLAGDPGAYAIYVFAISICFFLTYGDLGFLGAAQKYCAEEVGRGQLKSELEYMGFVMAVLMSLGAIFFVLMLVASYEPTILLPNIDLHYLELASDLFLVLAIFMPIQVILQRFAMLVLASRLREYIAIRLDIVANTLKIFVAPLFQSNSGFLLEYFLLTSILLSIASACVAIILTRYRIDFPVTSIFQNIRFTSHIYTKLKDIAFSSLFATILFIGYYEFDLIIAARFFTLDEVAAYALAFILMNFIRNLSAIIYSPLLSYLNRIWGRGEKDVVFENFKLLVMITVPLFMAVSVVLFFGSEALTFQWMGAEVPLTAYLFQVLLLGTFFVGVVNIVPLIAMTFELKHILYLVGLVPFICFYMSFLILNFVCPDLGIQTLAYAKAISGISAAIFGFGFLIKRSIIGFELSLNLMVLSMFSFLLMFILFDNEILFSHNMQPSLAGLLTMLVLLGLLVLIVWISFMMYFKSMRILIPVLATKVREAFK